LCKTVYSRVIVYKTNNRHIYIDYYNNNNNNNKQTILKYLGVSNNKR